MKKTYINPTCKVRAMKIEAIMADTIIDPNDPNGIVGACIQAKQQGRCKYHIEQLFHILEIIKN